MTASQVADRAAEHPFVKLATRVSMILVTLVVMPFTYWMVNTVYAVDKGYNGTLIIQARQQDQLASIVEAQARLTQTVADLTNTTARLDERIQIIRDQINRNYNKIDLLQDRIDRSPAVPDK